MCCGGRCRLYASSRVKFHLVRCPRLQVTSTVIPAGLSRIPVRDLTFDCCVVPVSQSVSSRSDRPPRSPHHRLKGRLRSPRSTQVLYSLARATPILLAYLRSVTASLPAHWVISGARCPILPGGIVIGNQVGGGGRGEGGRVLSTVVITLPSFGCLAAASTHYGPCVGSASVNHVDHPR